MTILKQEIKYVAFYNINNSNRKDNRNTCLALNNKVNYICGVLKRNEYKVEIISPCWTNNDSGYYSGGVYSISDGIKFRNFATFGSNNFIIKRLKYIFSLFQLLLFLLLNTKTNEQIIVYHSLALCLPISIAKNIKRLKIILEIEEIYSNVWENSYDKNKEMKYIRKADKYIFASDILSKKFTFKPKVVLYGGYKVIEKGINKKNFIKTVNIVYAGSIDKIKGGAMKAVLCAQYLPKNYKMHIIGFGSDEIINKLNENIKLINNKKGYKCCTYHGILVGNEYKCFLQMCHIGLNPQNEGEYMNTAFPSKILSYLSHGLVVVSTRVRSIQESKISKLINFTEDDNPKSIANTIKAINIDKQPDNVHLIKKLDMDFTKALGDLLKK